MKCPACGSKSVKNGKIRGKQRFKCKKCNYQFTYPTTYRAPEIKVLVMYLYQCGVSMRNIAKLLHISPTTIHDWIKSSSSVYQQKASKKSIPVHLKNFLVINKMRYDCKYKQNAYLCLTIKLSKSFFLKDIEVGYEEKP